MRSVRVIVLAMICVAVLPAPAPVRAASCNGASHNMTLDAGTATPATGTTSTPIRFSVRYTDNANCQPTQITVTVSGVGTFALSGSGSNYTDGATFQRTMTLPAGRHGYSFRAVSGAGAGEAVASFTSVRPSAVVIAAATPKPAPPPPPPPAPTPTPVPKPPAAPPPPPPPPSPTATPSPTPSPTATVSPTPTSTQAGTGSPTAEPTQARPSPIVASPEATRTPRDVEALPPSPSGHNRAGAGGWLDPSHLIGMAVPIAAYVSMTAAGLLLFFALLPRRRRDGAATGADATAMAALSASSIGEPALRAATPVASVPTPAGEAFQPDGDEAPSVDPSEAGVPRWLRPSVRAARQEGPRLPRDGWR